MFKPCEYAMIRCLMELGTVSQMNGTVIINDEDVTWEIQILTESSNDGSLRYAAWLGGDFETHGNVVDALEALDRMAHEREAAA